MKLCPFCAEEIQDAAIRCKHCHSDLSLGQSTSSSAPGEQPHPLRAARRVLAGVMAALVLVAAAPVVATTVSRVVRTSACQPSSWGEWHDAFRKQCLDPSYVCKHMTTPKLLEDQDLVHALGRNGSRVADVVGRMRDAYGCSPEREPAFHPGLPEPGPFAPPAFPSREDTPRAI